MVSFGPLSFGASRMEWAHVFKFNPNHGKDGRFTSAAGGGAATGTGVKNGKFSEQQSINLRGYAEGDYRPLNAYLKGRNSGQDEAVGHLDAQAKSIDAALKKSRTTQDITVYRGFSSSQTVAFSDKLVGRTIEGSGNFVSTSRNQGVAEGFAAGMFDPKTAVLIKLNVPKGSKALAMDEFATAAANSGEQEVLLSRKGKYKVTGVRKHKLGGLILEADWIDDE